MKGRKFSAGSGDNAAVENVVEGTEDEEDIVRVSSTKPSISPEKEDPYLEGIADSMVIAFFLAAAIKLYLYFFPMA
ncbi:hypothetical protein EON63_05570 [archaeon]|nr:MAG: hypothetical protein EON63_05570 [archaeon]